MAEILIIDDDAPLCDLLGRRITAMGHRVSCLGSIAEGLEMAASGSFDVVLLDVHMPDGNGLASIPRLKASPSQPEVIIVTGCGGPEGAEAAISSGAWDYIEKGSSLKEITLALNRVIKYRLEKRFHPGGGSFDRSGIIGSSAEISAAVSRTALAAGSDLPVLITGETGTGKELFAKAVHANSSRRSGQFVTVDCAGASETLLHGLLFGYEKGAFTGADHPVKGLLAEADGGTLFLDEIGELPTELQKVFLRALQEKKFRPLGSGSDRKSEFRLVAATNRDIGTLVSRGLFRQDLLFRISGVDVELPPLRRRGDDAIEISVAAVRERCMALGLDLPGLSSEFIHTVMAYDWPGNVRELLNAVNGALSLSTGHPSLYPCHLPAYVRINIAKKRYGSAMPEVKKDQVCIPSKGAVGLPGMDPLVSWKEFRSRCERAYLENIIEKCGGDIAMCCSVSGLSRSRFYSLVKDYGIGL